MPQTSYLETAARNGMIAEVHAPTAIDSYSSDADQAIGTAVAYGASDGLVADATAATDATIAGVVTLNIDANVISDTDVVEAETMLSVMRQGVVWVNVEDAVAIGGVPHVRVGGAGTIGAFRSDVDGGDAIALTGAVFRSSTAGAGLAMVALNRP